MSEKHPIKEEYYEYYKYLEALRQSGVTNMFGAVPYLRKEYPQLSYEEASAVLSNWMTNYTELVERGIIDRD